MSAPKPKTLLVTHALPYANGPLHIGHLFGTIANRVKIQGLGATTFIVIADYQVLTDRDTAEAVGANVHEVVLDYLASGLDPENGRTFVFSHSHVPELNQLLLPFMSLVTTAELDRNPTVKDEVKAAGFSRTIIPCRYATNPNCSSVT